MIVSMYISKLLDDILLSMKKQDHNSSRRHRPEFDTVDHGSLLDVLDKRLGVRDTALKWVDSYLRPKNFKV